MTLRARSSAPAALEKAQILTFSTTPTSVTLGSRLRRGGQDPRKSHRHHSYPPSVSEPCGLNPGRDHSPQIPPRQKQELWVSQTAYFIVSGPNAGHSARLSSRGKKVTGGDRVALVAWGTRAQSQVYKDPLNCPLPVSEVPMLSWGRGWA